MQAQALRDSGRFVEYCNLLDEIVARSPSHSGGRHARAVLIARWNLGSDVVILSGIRAEQVLPRIAAAYNAIAATPRLAPRDLYVTKLSLERCLSLISTWSNLPVQCAVAHVDTAHVKRMVHLSSMMCCIVMCMELLESPFSERLSLSKNSEDAQSANPDEHDPVRQAAGMSRFELDMQGGTTAGELEIPVAHSDITWVIKRCERARNELEVICAASNAMILKRDERLGEALATIARVQPSSDCADDVAAMHTLLEHNLRDRLLHEPDAARSPVSFDSGLLVPPFDVFGREIHHPPSQSS